MNWENISIFLLGMSPVINREKNPDCGQIEGSGEQISVKCTNIILQAC